MEVLTDDTICIHMYLLNVIDARTCRAGEDALGQVRCRGLSEDRRTDKDITIYSVHD